MDRCFYSEDNINALFKEHLRFMISAKMSLAFIRHELDTIYDGFRTFEHYSEKYELYYHTIQTKWHYTQHRPYKGDTLSEPRRIYIHYYYNIDKAAEDEKAFDRKLIALRHELESGKRVPEHKNLYKKYFETKSTPKRGTKVTINEEAVNKAKRYYGFFALLTNEIMDAITALELYRNKDVVEKTYGNLKDQCSNHTLPYISMLFPDFLFNNQAFDVFKHTPLRTQNSSTFLIIESEYSLLLPGGLASVRFLKLSSRNPF